MGGRTFPTQWHVEASTTTPREQVFVLTVLRPYRRDERPAEPLKVEQNESAVLLCAPRPTGTPVRIGLRKPWAKEATIGDLQWTSFAIVDDGRHKLQIGAE